MMVKAATCFALLSLITLSSAFAADVSTPKERSVKRSKYHVDFQPANKKASNTFQDMSQSMPAAAVKENLSRRHELPSAQTAVLRPGGSVGGTAAEASATAAANTQSIPAQSGAAPKILSPGKVAEPEANSNP